MNDETVIDSKTIKVLASEKRKAILKNLSNRRMTLSELAAAMGMSFSAMKEHLDLISSAGLIEQKDDGHKWKYYELTRKGRYIINPVEKRVFIVIGISVLSLLFSSWRVVEKTVFYHCGAMDKNTQVMLEEQASRAAGEIGTAEASNSIPFLSTPYPEIIILAISILIIGICIGYLLTRQKISDLEIN